MKEKVINKIETRKIEILDKNDKYEIYYNIFFEENKKQVNSLIEIKKNWKKIYLIGDPKIDLPDNIQKILKEKNIIFLNDLK